MKPTRKTAAQRELSRLAAALGAAGRGKSKRRGDRAYYQALAAKRKTHGREKPSQTASQKP